jgi:hypothetical protein
MKIHIHPKYIHLKETIAKIPEGGYEPLRTFCNSRNIVEQINIGDCAFVVKSYKVPNFANRIIYSFFRRSKAHRAYDNALRILRCGVSTPFPVAYIETKKKGLFHRGYFISEYMGYPTLTDYKNIELSEEERNRFKEDFLNFTIELHEKNILPLDYNAGNIFCHKDENSGRYLFSLTDINRAEFGNFSKYKPMLSFAQMGLPPEKLVDVMTEYSSRRKLDLEASLFLVLFYRIRRRVQKFFKRRLKEVRTRANERIEDKKAAATEK